MYLEYLTLYICGFSQFHFHFSVTKKHFSSCGRELCPRSSNLTYVYSNRAKYVGQRSFFSKVMTNRQTHLTQCVPTAATAGRRQSRSAVSGVLMVPWTRTSTGQRSFAVYGPEPGTDYRQAPALRLPELSLSSFKRQLKTNLFQHYT